mgnify:CR=1 FL=1
MARDKQEEFRAAAAAGQLSASSAEELKKSFDQFDVDHDGFVTTKEIEKLCGNMDPAAAKAMIGEVDKNGDGTVATRVSLCLDTLAFKPGKINFDEWLAAMRGSKQGAISMKQVVVAV